MERYAIDENIETAQALPGRAYRDDDFFSSQKKVLFPQSWQFIPVRMDSSNNAWPVTLLPELLSEPLMLIQHLDQTRAYSNVCTHRGATLIDQPAHCRAIRCPYHGRSFGLDGRMLHMPAFDRAANFPSPADHLSEIPLEWAGPFPFVSLNPCETFLAWTAPFKHAFGWVPWNEYQFAPELCRDYPLNANWMLYVDNYLEGLHIPYVHPALNRVLDFRAYQTSVIGAGVLQVGFADAGEDCFDLPADHPHHGSRISAYYLWLFPNVMLNLYPWGLSLNLVEPIEIARTRIRYFTWIYDSSRLNVGAGADTDRTEREDHHIILRVQQGIHSSRYVRGRYSPSMEVGVHHFHRLLIARS